MPNERILIIDDDPRVTDLLTRLLVQEKYEVATASTGREALPKVTAWRPNLIILDLMLPDVDGYALLEHIKKNSQSTVLPVMIVSARGERNDKLRGLRLGVMDYLTKPFDRQELLARIRNILDFHYAHINLLQQRAAQHLPRRIVDFLREQHIQTLVPRLRREAKAGYEYPEVASLLQPAEVGGEIFVLEQMANDGVLERAFFDTILACPQCGVHDLHFREVCPSCGSADLQRPNAVDGDRTAAVAGTSAAQRDKVLSAVTFHPEAKIMCHGCNNRCEPAVVCRCPTCARLFHVHQAQTRRIYAYRVPTSQVAPAQQRASGAQEALPGAFNKLQMTYVGEKTFFDQVELHVRGAKEQGSRFSLLGLHLRHIFGEPLNNELAGELLGVLKSTLRQFDIIGMKSPYEWMILLPETPFSMAKILAARLDAACERLAWEESLDMSLASYPEDGLRAEELLQILELGIVTVPKL